MTFFLPMLELHSVLVRFEGEETDITSFEVYGEVKAKDSVVSVHMFKEYKDSSNSGTVLPDGTLSLMGPSRCILGPTYCFFVCLYDKKSGLEISNGYFHGDPLADDSWYDKPVRVIIPGKHGFVVLHYSMFKEGVQASVRVKLLPQEGDDESSEKHLIYGTMYARYDNYDTKYPGKLAKKYFRSTLLYASSGNPKKLEDSGQLIPLSKSIVGVPDFSKLAIEAELWDTHYGVCETRPPDVKDTIYFFPDSKLSGPITIQGSNCSIEVEMEWFRKDFMEYIAEKTLSYSTKEA